MRAARRPARGKQGPRRDLATLRHLSRAPVLSHAQKGTDPRQPLEEGQKAQSPALQKLKAFLPWNLGKWGGEYLRHRFGKKHVFQTYPPTASADPAADNGIYRVANRVTVALASDWGTGTDEAADVAKQIEKEQGPGIDSPDITIHLGDVYYVGDAAELRANCLGEKNSESGYAAVRWPHGRKGSFALNGNHEMYARGMGYFDIFLPELGIDGKGQKASFFCLENDYWRVIALDTGYNSVGIPILELIPLISRIRWIGGTCAQEPEWIEWLARTVRPDQDDRALILLSHHQYYSAFDDRHYPEPAEQLAPYLKRPVLWFWGHEHRLAAYEAYRKGNGIEAIGRCIGHGGMPVELDPQVSDPDCHKALKFFDNRQYDSGEGIDVGFNGFAHLTFDQSALTVRYLDVQGNEVLFEEWVASNGSPTLVTFRPMTEAVPQFS